MLAHEKAAHSHPTIHLNKPKDTLSIWHPRRLRSRLAPYEVAYSYPRRFAQLVMIMMAYRGSGDVDFCL